MFQEIFKMFDKSKVLSIVAKIIVCLKMGEKFKEK